MILNNILKVNNNYLIGFAQFRFKVNKLSSGCGAFIPFCRKNKIMFFLTGQIVIKSFEMDF